MVDLRRQLENGTNMKRITQLLVLGTILFTGACFGAEFRRASTFEDAFKASCRVSVSNARGTGTFIGYDRDKDRCVILTNYHVVTNNGTATLDFWTNGVRESVNGKVYARFYDAKKPYDFALIAVDPNDLERIAPPYVALAGRGAFPDSNSYILSAGCPKGRFVQAWKGKILGYYNGVTVEFQPAPVPGQSGSGVLSIVDGQLWLTAVLTWLIGQEGADSSKGGAIPIANLYDALRGGASRTAESDDSFSPIPPGAVECADKSPYVVEYTSDKCPPCVEAKKDVSEIQRKGYAVQVVNVDTETGYNTAKKNKVSKTPCFVVCDGNGVEKARFYGKGKSAEILEEIERITPKYYAEPLDTNLVTTLTNDLFSYDFSTESDSDFTALDGLIETKPQETTDFRSRPPVYDYKQEDVEDVGLFEDSDALWRNRRGRKEEIKPTPKESEPTLPPTIDEEALGDRLGDRLGNRLRGGLSNSLGAQIDGAIAQIEQRIEDKIDSRVDDVKNKALDVYNQWKWRVLMTFIGFIICSVLIAEAVKEGVKRAYSWLMTIEDEDAEEESEDAKREETNEKTTQTQNASNRNKNTKRNKK